MAGDVFGRGGIKQRNRETIGARVTAPRAATVAFSDELRAMRRKPLSASPLAFGRGYIKAVARFNMCTAAIPQNRAGMSIIQYAPAIGSDREQSQARNKNITRWRQADIIGPLPAAKLE